MTRGGPVRVAIAEDDALFRAALADVIEADPGLRLTGSATDAEEAVELAEASKPDVFLLDVRMPRGSGMVAARAIRERSPQTRIVVLSAYQDRSSVVEMLRAGAVSYVVKGAPPEEIVDAIHHAAAGGAALSDEVTGQLDPAAARRLSAEHRELAEGHERVGRIQAALAAGIDMVFQPIVDLGTFEVVGMEALARFRGEPARGPAEWFAEGEEAGLAVDLDLAAAQAALARSGELAEGVFVAINVSPAGAASPRLLEAVASGTDRVVVLELSERAQVADEPALRAALAALREVGVGLALDDLDAGFASLRRITRMRPDFAKLDIELTSDLDRDPARRARATALVGEARAAGARVVAEGIERREELAALRELGVEYGQGYLLARPAVSPAARAVAPI